MKGVKVLNLRYADEVFAKLEEKKKSSKARSWETYILHLAGIEEEV